MRSLSCCGIHLRPAIPPSGDAQLPQSEVRRVYDRIAPVYDLWGALTESRAQERALQVAGLRDGERVLEVAAGTGLMLRSLVDRNPAGRTVGVDISPAMLARARRRLAKTGSENHELRLADALDLPFGDRSFDLLVNGYMVDLLAFEQIDRVLSEFRRVLDDAGRLVLINMTVAESVGASLYERLSRRHPRLLGGCRGVRMADKLGRLGFEVIHREYLEQLLFPSEVILARKRPPVRKESPRRNRYPSELEREVRLDDGGRLLLRPVRREDFEAYKRSFSLCTAEEIRLRLFTALSALPDSLARRLTDIDYDREMAFVLTDYGPGDQARMYAATRLVIDPGGERAEFAIIVCHDLAHRGLGRRLMRHLIDHVRRRGIKELVGEVLSENERMLALCRSLAFRLRPSPEDARVTLVELTL